MEDAAVDPQSGEETVQVVKVPQSALQALKASVKVDITSDSQSITIASLKGSEIRKCLTGKVILPHQIHGLPL